MRRNINILLASGLFAISPTTTAQDPSSTTHQYTSANPNARFEVLQSHLAARLTFRLDRFTGRVWQLVRTANDENTWEETLIRGLPPLQAPTRPRFQLFTSGLAARHTFLIDSESGKTWVLVASKFKTKEGVDKDYIAWQPFPE